MPDELSNEAFELRIGDLLGAWGVADPYDRAKRLLCHIAEEFEDDSPEAIWDELQRWLGLVPEEEQ